MYILALLLLCLVSFPRQSCAREKALDSLKRASRENSYAGSSAVFDGTVEGPLPLAVTASSGTLPAMPVQLSAPPAYDERAGRRDPAPRPELYELHKQEDNPAWVVQNGAQMFSSGSGVFSSVGAIPLMIGPFGWVLGGIFSICAAAVMVQAGVETYKTFKKSF